MKSLSKPPSKIKHTPFMNISKTHKTLSSPIKLRNGVRKNIKIFFLLLLICSLTRTLAFSETFVCTRVVDGDTIVVKGIGKVRLIGVDTPETKHPRKPVEYFGKEASNFTKRMVEGKKVRLEYDWQKKDKYNRVLAYIYVMTNDARDMPEFKNRASIELMLNAELIKQGYGHAYTKYPFKYLEQFRIYEKEARENKRGLWK